MEIYLPARKAVPSNVLVGRLAILVVTLPLLVLAQRKYLSIFAKNEEEWHKTNRRS